MTPTLRSATLATLLALAACGGTTGPVSSNPAEITAEALCSLDGMSLTDYPGPKAQLVRRDGRIEFFCDTVELFHAFLQPEAGQKDAALYVQDMGRADWNQPRGFWIDARSAVYVKDSSRRGPMGPTLVPFARPDDAKAFALRHGGKVVAFAEVNADMVVLDGGALHDQKM